MKLPFYVRFEVLHMDEKTKTQSNPFLQMRPKDLILLNVLFLIYSFVSVCQKSAANELNNSGLGSPTLYLWLAGALFLLVVYALIWQQILKRVPLSVAYSNKVITMLWLLLWTYLFFGVVPKWNNYVGIALAVAGVILVVWKGKGDEDGE